MIEYISREVAVEKITFLCELRGIVCNPDDEFLRGLTNALNAVKSLVPSADVQPIEKVDEYRSLLEECERKFRYLLECEIESSSESQKVKELIAKIQSSLKDGGIDETG